MDALRVWPNHDPSIAAEGETVYVPFLDAIKRQRQATKIVLVDHQLFSRPGCW